MRVSTKEDLYGFLDSFEESIRSEYMTEYLDDIFLEYYKDFNNLSYIERENVIEYLSTTYIDNYPDYAIALSILPSLRGDSTFKKFQDAINEKHDRLSSYKDEYDYETNECIMMYLTNCTYELLNELEYSVTKRLLNLLNAFNFDYDLLFEDWPTIDYMFDSQDHLLVDAVYNVVDRFNNHFSDHYLYTDNETGLYLSNIVKDIRSKISLKDLETIKWVNTKALAKCMGFSYTIIDDIKRDIIDEFSLNISTDLNLCIIVVGIILECLRIDLDYDQCYDDYSIRSLYDYVVYNYSAVEYAINLDK